MISATFCHARRLLVLLLLPLTLFTARAATKESWFVVEAHSGRVLIAQGATERKPVASLTKVATALVVLDWVEVTKTDLGSPMVVPPSAALLGGANPMGLRPGDQITVRNALYSALLGSDNVSAHTLANHVGSAVLRARNRGGDPQKTFVTEMNELAKALGMKKTKFANAHGMDTAKERGSSRSAMESYIAFRGREPQLEPLLRHYGIAA